MKYLILPIFGMMFTQAVAQPLTCGGYMSSLADEQMIKPYNDLLLKMVSDVPIAMFDKVAETIATTCFHHGKYEFASVIKQAIATASPAVPKTLQEIPKMEVPKTPQELCRNQVIREYRSYDGVKCSESSICIELRGRAYAGCDFD